MSERYEWLEGHAGWRRDEPMVGQAVWGTRRGGGYATEVEDGHHGDAERKRKAKKVMFKLPEDGGHREALRQHERSRSYSSGRSRSYSPLRSQAKPERQYTRLRIKNVRKSA